MKKERELHYLRRAMAVSADFPEGEPSPGEAPDFVFLGETRLGVELTDYIRPLVNPSITLRTVEALHERVALDAKATFEAENAVPLQVTMHCNLSYRLDKVVCGLATRREHGREMNRRSTT